MAWGASVAGAAAAIVAPTLFQKLILYGYGGGLFLLVLGFAGYRWPARTMRLAATANFREPVRSPGITRKRLFRAFSVVSAALGLLLLVWTTAQWV